MLWATSTNVHLDRVACAWLILRFIDPDADFTFVEPGAVAPPGAETFSLPGAKWAKHDADGTTFQKLLAGHELQDDPALALMGRILAAGVRRVFGEPPATGESEVETAYGRFLNEVGIGLGVRHDDAGHIAAALGMYDGVYVTCQIEALPEALRARMPPGPPAARNAFLREHLPQA